MPIERLCVSDVHISRGWSVDSQEGCYNWFSRAEAQQFGDFLNKITEDETIHEADASG